MTPGKDSDPELERQRAQIDAQFRVGWVPRGAGEPRVLTDSDDTEARKILSQGGWTYVDEVTIQAVRDGAQPGHPLPPLQPRPLINRVMNTEVIITGSGSGQRAAVMFSHEDFPGVRFGHRFPHPSEDLAEYAAIWLGEEIGTGALHRMMQDTPAADDAGVIWTTWGS